MSAAEDQNQARAAAISAAGLVSGLAAAGVGHCVICPGSRSAPVTMAFARAALVRSWVLVDERSAAFFALGAAKYLDRPVALVCTSGTAAANFLPAIVEAKLSATPLIVLTADRPPEARGSGALQVIEQSNMYGSFVRWFGEIPVPEPSDPTLATTAASAGLQAVDMALRPARCPVHLNLPYREPFIPEPGWAPDSIKVTQPEKPGESPLDVELMDDLVASIIHARRGLIVAGAQRDSSLPTALLHLAEKVRFPILADPASQLRACGKASELILDSYDLFLRSRRVIERLRPDLVLRLGATPVSKPLLSYLASQPGARTISIRTDSQPNDPDSVSNTVIDGDPRLVVAVIAERVDAVPSDGQWEVAWREISVSASRATDTAMAASPILSEPDLARTLSKELPDGSLLWVAASMPLRDLDGFFPATGLTATILANRGVNGIDGVMSTAFGAAAAAGRRVTVLIGDLAFHHDVNALVAVGLHEIDATIVLVDNHGGGIFQFLPQSKHVDVFERYFATPIDVDFGAMTEAHGGSFVEAYTRSEFELQLRASWSRPGLTIIRVTTDRRGNVEFHEELWRVAAAAADSAIDRL